MRVESANRFRKISERGGRGKVERGTRVIGNDPRKDGILCKIVESAASEVVKIHKIVEIGDQAILPFQGHVGLVVALDSRVHSRSVEDEIEDGIALKGGTKHEEKRGRVEEEYFESSVTKTVSPFHNSDDIAESQFVNRSGIDVVKRLEIQPLVGQHQTTGIRDQRSDFVTAEFFHRFL